MKSTTNYIKSPINYTGNKYKLLPQIIPLLPKKINTFVDLFAGSGTVLINVEADRYIYNDINNYVADIFEGLTKNNAEKTISNIESIISKYSLDNIHKESFERLRDDYNNGMNDWITLYTLMCFSFNNQFRFNNNHKYNSSFGKNRGGFTEPMKQNISHMREKACNGIAILKQNFEMFDYSTLTNQDFVYCDPPYSNSVGSYNDGKRGFEGWTAKHEKSLRDILDILTTKGVKWGLSNNLAVNASLKEWAERHNYNIHQLQVSYHNCNYHKKDRTSKDMEVLITNY